MISEKEIAELIEAREQEKQDLKTLSELMDKLQKAKIQIAVHKLIYGDI